MKLAQLNLPGQGTRAGVLRGDYIVDLTRIDGTLRTVNDILERSCSLGRSIDEIVQETIEGASRLDTYPCDQIDIFPDRSRTYLEMPIYPPEVWAFGVTYRRSADERDQDSAQDIYSRVYFGERPELFFKATPPRCVGPNGYICIRRDSKLTAVEAELAYVLGADQEIAGYTICNDVSAWDLERENPLYLPQSKIFTGCCALGPFLVTASEIEDPYDLNILCRIFKKDDLAYEGQVNTSSLNRRFESMTDYLTRDNPIPIGTTVSTGTGIMVPNELCLQDGDRVEIEIEGIGVLSNPVKQL